jgi:HSP20 family molecular chaperone IbpA
MAVRRWDPFRDLLGIQGSWVPPLDVYETQDRYIITAELAGMTTGDVGIEVGAGPGSPRGKEESASPSGNERG